MPTNDNTSIARTCLNGWWDFQPVFSDPADGVVDLSAGVPVADWVANGLLVPSTWNKPLDAVRLPGETRFHEVAAPTGLPAETEYLFDAYGYPEAWNRTRAGWLRRSLDAGPARPGRRRWLRFDGLMPRGWIFVGGRQVAHHVHPTLPLAVDIENALGAAPCELAVRLADYEREPGRPNRTLVPTGNWIPCCNSGVWQDVWLEERGEVRVAALDIRTSTRTRTLHVQWTIANDAPGEREVELAPRIVPWARHGDAEAIPAVLSLPGRSLRIPAHGSVTVTIEQGWPEAMWWEPGRPQLYVLVSALRGQGGETHHERFGFREVWLEGRDLMLNDHPVHLFSDWGHKMTPFYQTEGWIRQWFGMMRDGNLNHTRLHTHPHPTLVLDLADEEGILVTGEAGLHGSGGAQAADDPRYWEHARDHIHRFVARDRNRPCVIMWSVENEMRWNGDRTRLVHEQLPLMRAIFAELDPTRPAYHEGDSSLWSEHDQAVVSRHYGKECSGLGWWDGKRPLHSGEMSLYHYSGPNNICHLIGDRAWADVDAVDEAAALDTALIVESGRTIGVSCFGPWNLSCLQNPRPHPAMRLAYPDWTAPGAKPLRVAAGASEFRFWEGGAGYTPVPGFATQAAAFRPLALIDRSGRTGYRPGGRFRRELFLVNDTRRAVAGRIEVRIERDGAVLAHASRPAAAGRGRSTAIAIDLALPRTAVDGRWTYQAAFIGDDGAGDSWRRDLLIAAPAAPRLRGALLVHGNGSFARTLRLLGLRARRVRTLDARSLRGTRVLILERNAVRAGSDQNHAIRAFAAGGGRVLVLEQDASLFPGLVLEAKPVSAAWIRTPSHPVFAGLVESDLRNWGDDSYALMAADTVVASRMYRKDDGAAMLSLCDAGEGSFGNGGLDHTPLFATPVGRGLVVACQFLLTDAAAGYPAALRLAGNLLAWCDRWKPHSGEVVEAGDGDPKALVKLARAGATVLVPALDAGGLAAWSRATGVALRGLPQADCYQAVRAGDDPLSAGISNEDACGIATWTYCPREIVNQRVAGLAITPVAGLDPLWVLPARSLLREMFVDGGRSEPLRAYTRTPGLGHRPGTPGVVVGRLRLGRGQVLFDQFVPPGPTVERRHLRLARRLRANLGVLPTCDLLDGPCTAGSPAASRGWPEHLHVRHGALGAAARQRLLADCAYSPERLLNRPILDHGGWERLADAGGRFSSATGERWLYLVVASPVARQNRLSNLGVPNPEALTFCDVDGHGRIELWINGQAVGTSAVPGTLTDLALEQGNNHLLLRWTGGREALGLRFRNIMRRDETDFAFP